MITILNFSKPLSDEAIAAIAGLFPLNIPGEVEVVNANLAGVDRSKSIGPQISEAMGKALSHPALGGHAFNVDSIIAPQDGAIAAETMRQFITEDGYSPNQIVMYHGMPVELIRGKRYF